MDLFAETVELTGCHRTVAAIIRRVFKAQIVVYKTLLPIAEQRLRDREIAAEIGLEMPRYVLYPTNPDVFSSCSNKFFFFFPPTE